MKRSVLGLVALACAVVPSPAAGASFKAGGSVEQVYATGLAPKAKAALVRKGRTVATKRADALGGLLFRNVKPGSGYRVRIDGGDVSGPVTVLAPTPAPPDPKVYEQELPASGYGYLTTRDGTKLAISVHPPQDVADALPTGSLPPLPAAGPTPTLIEYSGYGYANPAGPTNGIAAIANVMGFTVVDVNMRGTGCSGGAFDFFEPLQSLDGYDVVETVARQPWVANGKVGMMGISYGGISQLFTAALRPPSLAAISPLSVLDSTQTTLYPGGILNTGFAVNWAKERIKEARPAGEDAGQEWAYKRVQEGDETCKDNQVLHGQAANLLRKIRRNRHYRPAVADPLAPETFVDRIEVPTFLACQWQDEQTGGHCPALVRRFTGTDRKWFTFTNGTHIDSLDPETFNRWYDFLQLYVARQAPMSRAAVVRAAAPVIYDAAMGIDGVTLPPDPIQEEPTFEGARTAFEAQPPVRVLFDNGAGGEPGHPYPGFERSFARLPVPGTAGRSWYFGAGGALSDRPASRGADAFRWDAGARPKTDFEGNTGSGAGGLWTATPGYRWQEPPAGTAVSYLSEPLGDDVTVVGAGAVHAWIRSSKPNVDLQATITEVRPDGKETFVQSGWLRANERKLDRRKSRPLEPVLSLRERDVRPLPRKRFVPVTIPLYYQGHAYRQGSRLRVLLSAPNGDQPIWAFDETQPRRGGARVAVAHAKRRPSRVTLPVVGGLDVPTGLPPCPGLRAQPCRDFAPEANRSAR